MVSLVVLFSTMAKSNTGVIAGVGFSALVLYMISFYPKLSPYTPTLLTAGNALVRGLKKIREYQNSVATTFALIVLCFTLCIPIFNKKQL
jgi:ABC-2 type transport system permease protein